MKILLIIVAVLFLVGIISDNIGDGKNKNNPQSQPAPAPAPAIRTAGHKTPLPKVDIDFLPNFHGTPGHGLEDSGFERWRIEAGQAGERALARIIAGAPWAKNVDVFFSLAVPGFADIDVDCAVLSGNDLWLLDAKRYAVRPDAAYTCYGGNGETLYLRALDKDGRPTGEILGEHHISRSTVMARQGFTGRFPTLTIHSATLLTPAGDDYPAIAVDAFDATGTGFADADQYVLRMAVSGERNVPCIVHALEALCK